MSKELKIENQLDSHLKQVKVGETAAPIEISTEKIRINKELICVDDVEIEGGFNVNSRVIKFPDLIDIQTSEALGGIGLTCQMLSVLGASWAGSDGDAFNNDAVLALFASPSYDARIQFLHTAAIKWNIGVDGSDSDKFIFNSGTGTLGSNAKLTLETDGDLTTTGDVSIAAAKGLYFDGGGDTYIYEAATDNLRLVVGGDVIMHISEQGNDGNQVYFQDASVGFTQKEPSYNSVTTNVDFRHSNKQNLTFGAGNITNLRLFFPSMSGNFTLLIKQDGTGSRTVTNYKVYEFDESLADGEAAVKWAGGSAPTLTTDANHVDILSFYWDADNEICYGVATLDFQF